MAATAKDLDISMALGRVVRAQRGLLQGSLGELGLHPGQEQLLLALYEDEGITQARLAEELGVEAPTVTKMVQRLEAAGVVTRERHPEDRRALQVFLTSEGRALRRDVRRAWSNLNRKTVKGLSDRQQATLRSLLAQVADNLGEPLV